MTDILEYLRLEAYPEEPLTSDLAFLRTAMVEGTEYWMWQFTDSDRAQCYVTASRRGDQITVGYERNYDSLTPEQYTLAEARGWI